MESHPFIQEAFNEFAEIGRMAVLQELNLRLLADKTPSLKEISLNYKLEDVEKGILDCYKDLLSEEDVSLIKESRQIRNKILHCEFDDALERISKLTGVPFNDNNNVVAIDIKELSPEETVEQMVLASSGVLGERASNINDNSVRDVGIFGWLLQLKAKGAFIVAQDVFIKTNLVIDKLIDHSDDK